MNIEMLNPHVIKILIAARETDSISSISERIGLSYGWTHKWVKELIKEGILKEKWRGFTLNESNSSYKEILGFVRKSVNEIGLYYSVLNLSGVEYCFTKTDAVYFWTEGRYNIARYRDYYPIFVKINKKDYGVFTWYCKKLNLKINSKEGVFYSPEISDKFNFVKKEDYFVEPLDETIRFMKKNIYNFEPALEMVHQMYKRGLNTKYSEANRWKS
jgi:DNA-binding Lrp family transcriptional regulator